jgi:hypothetical protein
MSDTCPHCHRLAVPLEQWRFGDNTCGNDWLSRGGGRRNVCVAMHDCRQARDRWQTAEIERLTGRVADLEQRLAMTPDILRTSDHYAVKRAKCLGIIANIAARVDEMSRADFAQFAEKVLTQVADGLRDAEVNYNACARLEVENAKLRAELAEIAAKAVGGEK